MSRYILDTDHVTLFQYGQPKIAQRAKEVGGMNIFVTTVTLEEQLRGRLAGIQRANRRPEQLTIAYENLQITLLYFCSMNLLNFDNAAYNCYQSLRQQKIRIGTHDLRIAAIALVNQGIVVTRNQQDFGKVPGLDIDDWTI
ncbi:type II toxin-antitoxin system VapC family toxin [Oscillatoria salina]|uniref:type II toxin-antitoxin system VapC family toxin n=1 Tax=Oscillatoria salina TaxID=331517 RepID=UPI0013B95FE0|nr:type II toxin-antitoxin system VapC family toxin [Oscillatoria salina]MBZ8182409.1 type II toxin-antitoxin system VapC family toxin [Oscillatoria salina IIICB1]NET88503.1 type II toxin-antitoxin system VapC family toxin [Kamptonema sp. SIO1D9]